MTSHITVRDVGPAGPGMRSVNVCAGPAGPGHRMVGALVMPPEDAAELAARVAAGEIEEAEVTWEIASHVLARYGQGGMVAGSFTQAKIEAIATADWTNRLRMAAIWPGYVLAVTWAKDTADGIARLRAIADRVAEREVTGG